MFYSMFLKTIDYICSVRRDGSPSISDKKKVNRLFYIIKVRNYD